MKHRRDIMTKKKEIKKVVIEKPKATNKVDHYEWIDGKKTPIYK